MKGNKGIPLSLFISYAHEDEPLLRQLETHLSLLRRQGIIKDWHDRKIVAGTKRAEEIDAHLDEANLVLLLISPDFLASNYCYDIEMQRALTRQERGEAHVIPIIVRSSDWHNAPFALLQCLPKDARPVTNWPDRDQAWNDVIRGIRKVISLPPNSEQLKTSQAKGVPAYTDGEGKAESPQLKPGKVTLKAKQGGIAINTMHGNIYQNNQSHSPKDE